MTIYIVRESMELESTPKEGPKNEGEKYLDLKIMHYVETNKHKKK